MMEVETMKIQKRDSVIWFVIAGIGFIPLLGIPFGLSALLRGVITYKKYGKLLAIISIASFLPMTIAYSTLHYFSQKDDGVFAELTTSLHCSLLTQSIGEIEMHKLSTGKYPNELSEVNNRQNIKFILEADGGIRKGFYYKSVDGGKKYILGNVGKDNIQGTADDIVPMMKDTSSLGILNGKIGDQ